MLRELLHRPTSCNGRSSSFPRSDRFPHRNIKLYGANRIVQLIVKGNVGSTCFFVLLTLFSIICTGVRTKTRFCCNTKFLVESLGLEPSGQEETASEITTQTYPVSVDNCDACLVLCFSSHDQHHAVGKKTRQRLPQPV